VESGLRNRRTCEQWLRSIAEYCLWRAGESWRSLRLPEHRNDPERWDYLDAARLIEDCRHAPIRRIEPVLPALDSSLKISAAQSKLAVHPRSWLVARLMEADSGFTDRRILSHLSRIKLAGMLAAMRQSRRVA
jgi:hypothetical protein